jgi:glucuronyl/N-acetylglucosaminyl transferase EXT1
METCFDKTKCLKDFKIYVYPIHAGEKLCPLFAKILKVIKESSFYTDNPSEACLFIPSIDTLDRDRLSADYVQRVGDKIRSLPFWNSGTNHIILNLFSGTWPDYAETLGFDFEKAILAKASLSSALLRPGYDISLPLFPKSHPQKNGGNLPHLASVFPLERKYKLAFKGKRYLQGIGSDSRNALYHIHNSKDIVLLTTCKHGKGWAKQKDERCDRDNAEYDK